MGTGKFIISLDFELMWGVHDTKTPDEYGDNISGVHEAIPRLLEIFERYKIQATFSTVGFLFFENKKDLINNLPSSLPKYANKKVSPYEGYFDLVGKDETRDLYHFAPELIKQIQAYRSHEIGTHTFSHYYCLEKGQTVNDFKEDILSAKKTAGKYGIELMSLVFPRNQFNNDYLNVCKTSGIICVRGNERSWMYKVKDGNTGPSLRRAFKLIDTYINISGHHCYSDDEIKNSDPMNIAASRFLRPFSKKLKAFDSLRLKRITSSMEYAAKNNLSYHLWWHPHNFGKDQEENFSFLEKILMKYKTLNDEFNFKTYTMSGLAKHLSNHS